MGALRTTTILMLVVAAASGCRPVGSDIAIQFNDHGRYGRAASAAREALAANPDDPEAHLQLGIACSHLDSVGFAWRHFSRSLEIDPDDARRRDVVEKYVADNFTRHYDRGRMLLLRGSYAGAAGALVTATAADPRRGEGHYYLALTYARLAAAAEGFRDDAAAEYRRAVEWSSPADAYHLRAMAALIRELARMEAWEDALRWGERYVVLDTDNADVWLTLSRCHERLGNDEQARECLARAHRNAP